MILNLCILNVILLNLIGVRLSFDFLDAMEKKCSIKSKCPFLYIQDKSLRI